MGLKRVPGVPGIWYLVPREEYLFVTEWKLVDLSQGNNNNHTQPVVNRLTLLLNCKLSSLITILHMFTQTLNLSPFILVFTKCRTFFSTLISEFCLNIWGILGKIPFPFPFDSASVSFFLSTFSSSSFSAVSTGCKC